MSTSKLKESLPELDVQALGFVFDHVYDIYGMPGESQAPEGDKLSDFFEVLKALQRFNYRHRRDEARGLYPLVGAPLGLDPSCNSEGYFLWLAALLAIKDLYELDDAGLMQAVHRISVRK